jgi:4-amino-4-deoxy-L-arabinose transferase-like glycosyltransferase
MITFRPRLYPWIVILFAAVVFLTGVISPPSLMDDVDATQALMARNMLLSGDWVSARCDGVLYLEKAPLKYWMTAVAYMAFGTHDWVARLPVAFSAIALCWLVFLWGRWALSPEAGLYAGLFLSTCVGLFLFTRVIIPDIILTLAIALSLWALLRALDPEEPRPGLWAYTLWAALAAGILLKGLIGIVFPLGTAFVYLLFAGSLFRRDTWRRLRPFTGFLFFLAIAAPWHVLATLRNPPYFDFTMASAPGHYRGFFWFYFINEHLLRFLNLRYPRDYNTVPRIYFWLLTLAWLFPWSVYLPQLRRIRFRTSTRQGRSMLLASCWIGFVMVFFTFSTTQEYYSMPIYPALALLLGAGVALAGPSIRIGAKLVAVIAACAAATMIVILVIVWNWPTPGDISNALLHNTTPGAYSLALAHMQDLNLGALAYLRPPLMLAAFACILGAVGGWFFTGKRAIFSLAVMMVIFFQAARLALVTFDPYLSSRQLAEALHRAPQGRLIVYGEHNDLSALFFYGEDHALLLNGRRTTLEYGSNAPDVPPVFIENADFLRLWAQPQRSYLAIHEDALPAMDKILPRTQLHLVKSVGGKYLFTNLAS